MSYCWFWIYWFVVNYTSTSINLLTLYKVGKYPVLKEEAEGDVASSCILDSCFTHTPSFIRRDTVPQIFQPYLWVKSILMIWCTLASGSCSTLSIIWPGADRIITGLNYSTFFIKYQQWLITGYMYISYARVPISAKCPLWYDTTYLSFLFFFFFLISKKLDIF